MSRYPLNILTDPWIPVRRASGARTVIALADLTSDYADDPVMSFAWPRADFDLAAHELGIGALAAVYPADPDHRGRWVDLFHAPPTPAELAEMLAPLAPAFEVTRFLQDHDDLSGEAKPVDGLLLDAPGVSTVRHNADLFVKRSPEDAVLSRAAAAMALYTQQQYATSAGAGYRVGVRGGGPLTTLALPDDGNRQPTLWEILWLNTPSDRIVSAANMSTAFPWLAPTRTSTRGEQVDENDGNRLQALFGAPRRIRLLWAENAHRRRCLLTGVVDDVVCTGWITVRHGANYGVWRHPLSPYYKPATGDSLLPVHAKPGRLAYRNWIALVAGGRGREPAACVVEAMHRLCKLGPPWWDRSRLRASGWALDKAAARQFVDTSMPLHTLEAEAARLVEDVARQLVDAAEVVASGLGKAIKRALYGSRKISVEWTVLGTARERFWIETEARFHASLDDVATGTAGAAIAARWLAHLQRVALAIFDDVVRVEIHDLGAAEDVVDAKKWLGVSLHGYGPDGASLFKALALPVPEKGKKSRAPEREQETAE